VASRVLATSPAASRPWPSRSRADRTEQEVPGLIAKALNNAAIGQRLQLAPKTVRYLASSIFGKLQVADRAQAMRRVLDKGLAQ
jgi:DNA-binding NarL/FixJ family response regulator